MPQQRIHEVTANRLAKLKKEINEERKKIGEKPLTVPDIIESITEMFQTQRNIAIKEDNND